MVSINFQWPEKSLCFDKNTIKIHIVCSPLTEIRQRPIELNILPVISHSCHSWVEELWAVFNGACVCVCVCVCVVCVHE